VATATAQPTLFSTGIGNNTTSRSSGSGPAQRVSVSANTTIGSFGFWLGTTGAVDMKFYIFDVTTGTKIFEQTKSVNAATGTLTFSDYAAVNLLGGNTYDFGIIGNGSFNVSYFTPILNLTQDAFTVSAPNTNYGPYSDPQFQGSAGATIALEIRGADVGVVPEPSTYALMGTGLIGLVGMAGRKRARTA
jgi:hypothetical protein